jgi:hypothetical protein
MSSLESAQANIPHEKVPYHGQSADAVGENEGDVELLGTSVTPSMLLKHT